MPLPFATSFNSFNVSFNILILPKTKKNFYNCLFFECYAASGKSRSFFKKEFSLCQINKKILCIKVFFISSACKTRSAYRIHFWYMSKDDAINIMNNSNLIDKMGVL